MISHTNAFLKLRHDIQDVIDFAVLICHAVPSLCGYMKAVENKSAPKIPDTDYFNKTQPFDALRSYKTKYKKTLGRFVVLSSIAYFEMYIKTLLGELVKLHKQQREDLEQRLRNPLAEPFRRKLSDGDLSTNGIDGRRLDSYRKNLRALHEMDYPLPSDLFAAHALERLDAELGDAMLGRIPDLLKDIFFFIMDEATLKEYNKLRDLRNSIAHGEAKEIDLSTAFESNNFIRKLAIQIDRHIVTYFKIIDENALRADATAKLNKRAQKKKRKSGANGHNPA